MPNFFEFITPLRLQIGGAKINKKTNHALGLPQSRWHFSRFISYPTEDVNLRPMETFPMLKYYGDFFI